VRIAGRFTSLLHFTTVKVLVCINDRPTDDNVRLQGRLTAELTSLTIK